MHRIRKYLDEFNDNSDVLAPRKTHSGRSDKKRTPELVGEIEVMLNKVYCQGYGSD